MASVLRSLTDSLAAALQSIAWPAGTSVIRANWIELEAADMAGGVIVVAPGNVDAARAGQNLTQLDCAIHVFVGRHCDTDSEVNAAMDLADDVFLRIRAHQWGDASPFPEGITSPITSSIEINPDDGLNERNTWRAMIVATYRVFETDAIPA